MFALFQLDISLLVDKVSKSNLLSSKPVKNEIFLFLYFLSQHKVMIRMRVRLFLTLHLDFTQIVPLVYVILLRYTLPLLSVKILATIHFFGLKISNMMEHLFHIIGGPKNMMNAKDMRTRISSLTYGDLTQKIHVNIQ